MTLIALVSDLHSNLPASTVVFEKIDELDCDVVVCSGDLIGYYTQPLEIIDFLRGRKAHVIAGNHDAIATADDFRTEMQYFNEVARKALVWTRRAVKESSNHWDYIKSLPLTRHVTIDGYRIFLAHGTPEKPENWEYYYYFGVSDQESAMKEWLNAFEADVIALGHTHVPFVYSAQEKPFRGVLNPGSVGQPRDSDSRASFAVLDTSEHKIELHRLSYPIEAVLKGLQKESLPPILGERLYLGR